MRRYWLAALTLMMALSCTGGGASAGAVFLGPGPGLTGNDTGGIIAYTPDLEHGVFREMAADWCARWGRLSAITSVHRVYGDYVGFVCIDRPGHIH
jgi:hypothetical protein